MRRLLSLAVLTVAFLLALGGVAFAEVDVTIGDAGLDPETIEAEVNEGIVWTNATDADVSLVGSDPAWESGPIEPGATFSIKITREGTYTYESEDGSLAGEIVVGDGAAAAPDDGDGGTDDELEPSEPAVEEDVVDPDEEALPVTGIDPALPGALSLLLIAFGGGLLRVTTPARRHFSA